MNLSAVNRISAGKEKASADKDKAKDDCCAQMLESLLATQRQVQALSQQIEDLRQLCFEMQGALLRG